MNFVKYLIALDLSTTSTGWSVFNQETKELVDYGTISVKQKGLNKLNYPKRQLKVCQDISEQIMYLINSYSTIFQSNLTGIVIEEINLHRNRLAGKTLDALHAILWTYLESYLDKVTYIDSDGDSGWRSKKGLNLILSEADKNHNAEAKKINKTAKRGTKKIPIITKKHLACRFVNKTYNKNFDVDAREFDADICDSIGLGHVFLSRLK